MMKWPLDVQVDLRCEMDGHPLSIVTDGRKVIVEAESVVVFMNGVRLLGGTNSLRRNAASLETLLGMALLQIESRVNGRVIGRIGLGIGTRFWRLFGLPRLQLKPLAIVGSLLRRR